MSFRARLARPAIVLAAACLPVLLVSGCKSTETAAPASNGSSSAATPAATKAADAGSAVTGSPVGDAGDPCALVGPADVKAAFGQTVSSIKRNAAKTDEDGTTQQCVLITSGTPMDASAFKALAALAGGATGQAVGDQLPSAALGVVLNHLSKPATKEDMDGDMSELPPGSKKLSDLGLGGVITNVPTGSVGVVLLDSTHGLYITDLEGRKVPVDEMEKLLRAAVSHYK